MAKRASIMGRIGRTFAAWRGKAVDPTDRYFRDKPAGGGKESHRPYREVAAVYACVRKRMGALAQMPLMVSTAGDAILESGPQVEITERPNPRMTRRQFWKATSAYLDLTGACYWWFSDLGEGDGRRPIHVYPFSAAKFRKRVENGAHVGWWYRTDAGHEQPVPLEEVHAVIEPDYECGDDVPMSPRHAVHMAVQQYYKADRANLTSLDNDVQPGGVLSTDQSLTEEQRDAMREEVHETHAGVLNRRRLMITEGGLHFERVQAAFTEMEFVELKKMSRTDICAGYQVPPAVIGYYDDSNYAHADAAQRIFWVDTMMPVAEWLAEEWTVGVLPRFGAAHSGGRTRTAARRSIKVRACRRAKASATGAGLSFYAWFDPSDVPAVQAAQLSIAEQAQKWTSIGVPLNQVLAATDAPFEEVAWGNTWYKPIGLVDVQEDTSDLAPPGGSPSPDDAEKGGPTCAGCGLPYTGKAHGFGPLCGNCKGTARAKALSEAQLAALHTGWWNAWLPLQRRCRDEVRGHFNRLRNETMDNLKRVADRLAPAPLEGEASAPLPVAVADWDGRRARRTLHVPVSRRDIIAEVLFDIAEADRRLIVRVGPLLREGLRLGGEQSMRDAADAEGKETPDPFNIADPRAQQALRSRTTALRRINDTVATQIREQLAEGLAHAEPYEAIVERLQDRFELAYKRAATIARTEVGGAVEEGNHLGRVQAKIPAKSWLWSRRETGRPGHAQAEARYLSNPIPVERRFEIADPAGAVHECMHPRDSSLPVGEIVNCGCTTLSRFPGDDVKEARLFDALSTRGPLTYEQLTHRDAQSQREAA